MKHDFADRHVVVTGGTGALGSAVVRRIIDAGGVCHVPCVDARELERFDYANHSRVHLLMGGELKDEATTVAFYRGLPALWASIHCAGGFAMGRLEDTTLAELFAMFDVNALTCFLCCREAVKKIRATPQPLNAAGAGGGSAQGGGGLRVGRGRVVNVTARPALEPRLGAGMSAYTLAKSAVAALTQSLAQEVAEDGILVNAVVPSIMDTRANRRAMPDADFSKWPTLDEVASTIVFLASPENACTRGGLIPVFGGT